MGMSDNFGWMIGPAIAGTLVALIGAGGAIAVDGATFLVSAAFLAALRVPAVVKTEAVQGFFAELRTGWREVKSRTWLWVMLLRVGLVLFIVIAPFQILGPLGLREQGYGAAVWGWLQAVFSAGMIIGAFFALRYRPKRPMITVALTGSTAVAAPLAMAISGDPWVLAAVYGLRGVSVGVLVAVWNATLQTQVPRESLGRVTAWDWMASMALWPAGLALAGPLAQAFGVGTMCWITGGLGLWPPSGCCWSRTCGGCVRRQCWPAEPASRRRRMLRLLRSLRPPSRRATSAEVPAGSGEAARVSGRGALPATPVAAGVQQDVQHDPCREDHRPPALQTAERVLGDGVGDGGARHEDPADEAPDEGDAGAAVR